MNIAYFDLNHPAHHEDYSINPRNYGGGRIFAAHAKELLNNEVDHFYLYSDSKSLANVSSRERFDRCVAITDDQKEALRRGDHLTTVVPYASEIDLIVHHASSFWINTQGLPAKQVAWCLGYKEQVHPNAPYVINYNDFQAPILLNPKTKILKAVIGKPLAPFKENEKEDYIFQCTRHNICFGSNNVVRFCNLYGIKGLFAGPIDPNYDLLKKIDNKNTFYLGIINEKTKYELTRKARLYTFIHSWPTPFNLSAVEALNVGTPIAASHYGFWPSLVSHGKNGFLIKTPEDLLQAWNSAPKISQKDCFDSVSKFSLDNMIKDFYNAFLTVLNN